MPKRIPFSFEFRDRVTGSAGKFKLRASDYYKIYTLISSDGPFYYFIGDTLYEPQIGDVMIIRPGVLHGGYKKVQARYVRLFVTLSPDMIEYLETVDRNLARFFIDGAVSLVTPKEDYAAKYMRLAYEMRELTRRKSNDEQINLLIKLIEQLNIIYRAAKTADSSVALQSGDELVRSVITYINTEYASISTVSEIAARFNYSTNYLSQYFRRHMNIGLGDFLNKKAC